MEIMESSTLNEEELLGVKLRKFSEEYFVNPSHDNRENLLQLLQNNNCREVIVKCVDGDDMSNAFVCAGWQNHPDIFRAFLNQGMNVDIKNAEGNTALIEACDDGHEEIVRLLLNHNANPDVSNNCETTALMRASYNGHQEIVQLLLTCNADKDLKNQFGKVALGIARTKEIKEMIHNHVNTSYVLK